MNSDLFHRAFGYLLLNEGYESNDPDDPGGRTKWGISTMNWPDVDLDTLTLNQAAAFYEHEFWTALGLDNLPSAIAIKLFDTAVWMGAGTATRMLQLACNSIGASPLLSTDGILGVNTGMAVHQADQRLLMHAYVSFVEQRAYQISGAGPRRKFRAGWLARAKRVPT